MNTINSRYTGKKIYGIFNLSQDKDLDNIVTVFPDNLVHVYTAPTGNPRNFDHKELASMLSEKGISVKAASEAYRFCPTAVGIFKTDE